jgi:hypothetical protein
MERADDSVDAIAARLGRAPACDLRFGATRIDAPALAALGL